MEECPDCEKYAERLGKYMVEIEMLRTENELLKETVRWWRRPLVEPLIENQVNAVLGDIEL